MARPPTSLRGPRRHRLRATPRPAYASGITGTINASIGGNVVTAVASGAVSIAVGGSFDLVFTATPSAVGAFTNTATVDPDSRVTESNEGNNTGSDTVTVIKASPT